MTIHPSLAPLDPDAVVLGDEVYSVLGAAIRDGRLEPGQRLRDVELAEALGVSRTPVREALQRLERIGLVEVSANRYTRVSDPSQELLSHTLEFVAYAAGIALRMSLARSDDDELRDQLLLADAMVEASASDDVVRLVATSFEFYERVSLSTGNQVFLAIMREAGPFFERSLRPTRPLLTDETERTPTYRDLRDAIAARDGARAEAIVRAQHGLT